MRRGAVRCTGRSRQYQRGPGGCRDGEYDVLGAHPGGRARTTRDPPCQAPRAGVRPFFRPRPDFFFGVLSSGVGECASHPGPSPDLEVAARQGGHPDRQLVVCWASAVFWICSSACSAVPRSSSGVRDPVSGSRGRPGTFVAHPGGYGRLRAGDTVLGTRCDGELPVAACAGNAMSAALSGPEQRASDRGQRAERPATGIPAAPPSVPAKAEASRWNDSSPHVPTSTYSTVSALAVRRPPLCPVTAATTAPETSSPPWSVPILSGAELPYDQAGAVVLIRVVVDPARAQVEAVAGFDEVPVERVGGDHYSPLRKGCRAAMSSLPNGTEAADT